MPFANPITAGEKLITSGFQSEDYLEGVSGWRISQDGTAEFADVSAVGSIGARSVSADAIDIGGRDMETEILAPFAKGLKNLANVLGTVDTASVSAETKMFEWNVSNILADHYYMFTFACRVTRTVNTDFFIIRPRYTVDGTVPTASSSIMDRGSLISNSSTFSHHWFYTSVADYDLIRFAFTLARISGTGTAYIQTTDVNYSPQFACVDMGLQANVLMGQVVQSSVASGTVATTPVNTYTKSWSAIWSRSYDGDGGIRAYDDTEDMYQGYYSSTHGNTRSLAGFDYASIMSALSGATVDKVTLTFKVKYRAYSSGLDVYVSAHDYTTKPSSWSSTRVDNDIARRMDCNQGSTYTLDITSQGNNFKSGATKGIGFGPGIDNNNRSYGRLYGANDTAKPKLTITYRK